MPRKTNIGMVATSKEATVFDATTKTNRDWLNPIAMDSLQRAVKGKKTTVILNGISYQIKYGYRRTYPVSKETIESIHLTRTDGELVPRGYVSVKEIMNFQFEG
jgi:hypothetical protein